MRVDAQAIVPRLGAALRKLRAREAQLEPAREGTFRGAAWMAFVALELYLFSNPLVYIPAFETALDRAVLCAVVFLLVQLPWLRPTRIPFAPALFLGLAALSSTWSANPDDTWLAVRIYVLIALMGAVVGANMSVRALAWGLVWGGVLILAVSLVALLQGVPGAAVPEGASGYLAGVGTNRNILAYSLLPGWCALMAVGGRSRLGWIAWVFCLGSLATGLVLAESSTGYLTAAIVLLAALALLMIAHAGTRPDRRRVWTIRAGIVGATVGFALSFDRISELMGRDGNTLTGRVPLWEAIWQVMGEGRKLAGHGWGTVWPHAWQYASPNEFYTALTQEVGMGQPHGHNSFMDVLPQLGLLGVVTLAMCYVFVAVRALMNRHRVHAEGGDPAGPRLVLLVLLGSLAAGMTEPMALIPLGWFVLVAVSCVTLTRSVTPHPRHRHRKAPYGAGARRSARDSRN